MDYFMNLNFIGPSLNLSILPRGASLIGDREKGTITVMPSGPFVADQITLPFIEINRSTVWLVREAMEIVQLAG